MKTTAISFFLLSAGVAANAQSALENEAVMRPVKMLFEGMQKGDSALIRKAFSKTVTMATIGSDKTGRTFIRHESSIHDFLKAIGTPHAAPYNEII
ncbi:MAG TPA: hypothetical protein VKQ08_00925, partial [Cyclobacteriaceae bacterium]|nr:hypothetical protein [Cyclobacteriaceae bacterium]